MNTKNTDLAISGLVSTTSKSCWYAAGAAAALAITLGCGTAGAAADPGGTSQAPVRLSAATAPAATSQGQCGEGLDLMKVQEVIRMIEAPVSASDVEAADRNRDHYVCVVMPQSGGHPTHFEDNWYENSGGKDGCDKPEMSNGNGMDDGCGNMNRGDGIEDESHPPPAPPGSKDESAPPPDDADESDHGKTEEK